MVNELLDFTQIRMDGGTQPRAGIEAAVVLEYAEAMEGGAEFPPPVVFFDGENYWLADGFHRVHAWRRVSLAGRVACDIRQGSVRDAVLYSVGANAAHGLRRSAEDKRRAVVRLLEDSEWGAWSDRAIAEACRVSHPFVGKVRVEIRQAQPAPATGNVSSSDSRVYQRAGETRVMDTSRIGKLKEGPLLSISRLEGRYRDMPEGATLAEFREALDGEGVAYVKNAAQQARNNVIDQRRQEVARRLADMTDHATGWLRDYQDDKGRRWWDLSVTQTVHANSPCYQAWIRSKWAGFWKGATIGDWQGALEGARAVLEKEGRPAVVEAAPEPEPVEAVEAAASVGTPMYGGVAAVWGPLLGDGGKLPADQVGPALQWLLGEVEFLGLRVGDGVSGPLKGAMWEIRRALVRVEEGMR